MRLMCPMKFLRVLGFFFFFSGVQESLAQITCDFNSLNPGLKCEPYAIIDTAVNISSSAITERRWHLTGPRNFDVVNGSTNPVFSFIADTAGTYFLTMWTLNANGDTCSYTEQIDIAKRPTSNFTFSPTEGCSPL